MTIPEMEGQPLIAEDHAVAQVAVLLGLLALVNVCNVLSKDEGNKNQWKPMKYFFLKVKC